MKKYINKKTIVIFIIVVSLLIGGVITVSAIPKKYTYVDTNGETIEYYIDNENHTYIIENGEKVYIALPLEQYKITDENILRELNSELFGED